MKWGFCRFRISAICLTSLLFLSASTFAYTFLNKCIHLFVCYVRVSNDAVGHDRRWHLLLMVTPAQGGPRSRAPGKENLEGGRRDTHMHWHQYTLHPRKNTHITGHSGLSNGNALEESGFLIIHADLKSHSEFRPKRMGHILSQCGKPDSEIHVVSQQMFSEETSSTFSLHEKSPSGYCHWHYRTRICVLYE